MNKEKQIEEMDDIAEILCNHYDMGTCICNHEVCDLNCPIGRKVERLYDAGYRKQEWISVEERLPEENEVVLIWVGNVQVARIVKGITEEEREKMKSGELPNPIEICWSLSTGCVEMRRNEQYRSCDVFGNNLVPYSWKAAGGPMEWFGQNVSHWMPLPEPPKMKGGVE